MSGVKGTETEQMFPFWMTQKLYSVCHCRRCWSKNIPPLISTVCCLHWWTLFNFFNKVIFTYYLASLLDYIPEGGQQAMRGSQRAFWGFSPAHIIVSHHVSQLTPLAIYLSDSYYESGSMSCGLNGTRAAVHLPINKVLDHDDDLINLPLYFSA